MRKSVALVILSLVMAGCTGRDRREELQQQKATLDLMKAQNEQLAALTRTQSEQIAALAKKENELRALESKTRDTLHEIEREKALLEQSREKMRQDVLAEKRNTGTTGLEKGMAALNNGDVDGSITIFSKVIQNDPKSFRAFGDRGLAYCCKRDFARGIADLTEAIRLKPDDGRSYGYRGAALASLGLTGRAITDLTEAIKHAPENEGYAGAKQFSAAVYYCIRGLQYFRQRDMGRAIADFNEAIRLDANDHNAYYCRGLAYGEQNKYDQAINDFTAAIRLCPKFARPYCNRALALFKAVEAKSDAPNVYGDFAQNHRQLCDKAIADFKRLTK
jgi:tetratricopeptide (TPR) repeat protein